MNLRFDDPVRLRWTAVSGASGYHVYRGDIAGLPDNGACLLGSQPSRAASATGAPSAGTAWFYLVSAFDGTGEGTLGGAPPRSAATPCIIARRGFPLTPNGVALDGVVDGVEPRRNASAQVWSSRRETTGVYRHTGEFFLEATDVSIPGRGAGIAGDPALETLSLRRTYRSQIAYDGPLGHGWDFSANMRLVPLGIHAMLLDGSGRREVFGRIDPVRFTSPQGLYAVLRQNLDGSFALRWPDGRILHFHAFDGTNVQGALESFEDRKGNRESYLYDHQGLLRTIVDTLGRSVSFAYDAAGRITAITDFAGRSWAYSYDGNGNLVAVRTPIVSGTPTGNDFPAGKTTTYAYSSGSTDPALNHNLLTVTAPNEQAGGPALITNVYGTTPATLERDRVVSQTIGGTNAGGVPAGGTLGYAYAHLNPGSPSDLTTPRRETTVTDRNGNVSIHTHNFPGNRITRLEQTNRNVRAGEPDYTTMYAYNLDGELNRVDLPEGNRVEYAYDVSGLDRYRAGNLVEVRRVASGGRGDGHGGVLADSVWTFRYEPVYNGVETITEPRGNDPAYVPQNGGGQSAARYTTTFVYDHQESDFATNGIAAYAAAFEIDTTGATQNLGEQNGDGLMNHAMGILIRRDDPSVTLDPSSNQAAIEGDLVQEVVTLWWWNHHGQVVRTIDAESNVQEYEYYPETDPDGDGVASPAPDDGRTLDATTGGYLMTRRIDTTSDPLRNNRTNPPPTMVRHDFRYDVVGNPTGFVDGRGVLTRSIFNQLDQIVELRRAAATAAASGPDGDPPTARGEAGLTAFGFKERYRYDASDNLVSVHVEDRGNDRNVAGFFDVFFTYDLLDFPVETDREVDVANSVVTRFRYDPNENLVLTIEPEGNAATGLYDERDRLFRATRGATMPPPLVQLAAGDPTGYDVRPQPGSVSSTVRLDYDGNGNTVSRTDGRGNTRAAAFDGFDRQVRATDPLGNTTERCYDPVGDPVRVVRREPGGSPPSPCTSTSANDLAQTDILYDELGRPFGLDRRLFALGSSNRSPVLLEGSLAPGDGFVNRRYEYDRLSRRTFVVEDSSAETRSDYDGASRRVMLTLPDGLSTVERFYDASHNLIEEVATEVSSAGLPDEVFITTRFTDALDRPGLTVDNIGRARRSVYDSFDAVIVATDPRGPLSGNVNRRSPGRTGISVPINAHGNVTRYTRDGLGRLTGTERVLTASGAGDGTLAPIPDTSNPFNPDGLITLQTAWDDNSLVASSQDDRGNATTYAYDNLNRMSLVTEDDGTTTRREHDENDNVTSVTDANGSVLDRIFDAADRLVRVDVTRAAGVAGTTLQVFGWNGLYQPTIATDNNDPGDPDDDVTVEMFYDSLSRLIEEAQTIGTLAAGALAYTDHEWTADDLQTRTTYPDGREIVRTYDAAARLAMVDDADAGRPESAAFDYFAMRRVHTVTRNNGVTTEIGYDGIRRIVALRHRNAGSVTLAGLDYAYDRANNLRWERRAHHPMGPNLKGEIYARDSARRLVSFDEGPVDAAGVLAGVAEDTRTWSLDGASNWCSGDFNSDAFAFTPNNMNEYDDPGPDDLALDDVRDDTSTMQADGRNQGHDDNGNTTLTDDGANEDVLEYDAFNRLVEVVRSGSPIATYAYDAMGRRARREVQNRPPLNEIRRYLYGGGRVVEERNGLGATVSQAVAPGFTTSRPWDRLGFNGSWPWDKLWQVRGGGASAEHLLGDGRGSVVAVTPGALDTVIERVTYDAWGVPTFENAGNQKLCNDASPAPCAVAPPGSPYISRSTVGNPDLFRGLRYDPETGVRTRVANSDWGGMYTRNGDAYYNPNLGRTASRGASKQGNPYSVSVEPTDWDDHLYYGFGNPVFGGSSGGVPTTGRVVVVRQLDLQFGGSSGGVLLAGSMPGASATPGGRGTYTLTGVSADKGGLRPSIAVDGDKTVMFWAQRHGVRSGEADSGAQPDGRGNYTLTGVSDDKGGLRPSIAVDGHKTVMFWAQRHGVRSGEAGSGGSSGTRSGLMQIIWPDEAFSGNTPFPLFSGSGSPDAFTGTGPDGGSPGTVYGENKKDKNDPANTDTNPKKKQRLERKIERRQAAVDKAIDEWWAVTLRGGIAHGEEP